VRVLADTTALIAARRGRPAPSALFRELAEDELWICDVVRLEVLRGARSVREMATLRAELDEVASAPIDEHVWKRTEEVYAGLARLQGGRHCGVQPTDVLVAAAAEAQDLVVLHDDAQFDLIAEVTGQEMLRLPT
jgi:predicted nucleic acid-binding protein